MTAVNKPGLFKLIGIPAVVFIACTCITFSSKFKEHPDQLSLAVIADLMLTAPLAYFIFIRKTAVPKISVLRVFMAGIVLAGILLSKNDSRVLSILKTWVSPLVEFTLIGFIVWKFYKANQHVKTANGEETDFLTHCRAILTSVSGNEKMAHVFASEIAVFYYVFRKKDSAIDYTSRFTCYKENGIILVLSTFLCLFLIETAGMHFLFLLWSKTAAWILTTLSFYTCLQLFAHIKALKARSIIINNNHVLLRNGLMGGDAFVSLGNIEKVEMTNKLPAGEAVIKLALIKGLENHNLAIHLIHPVVVLKAFGIKKTARVLLIGIDKPKAFMEALESYTLKHRLTAAIR